MEHSLLMEEVRNKKEEKEGNEGNRGRAPAAAVYLYTLEVECHVIPFHLILYPHGFPYVPSGLRLEQLIHHVTFLSFSVFLRLTFHWLCTLTCVINLRLQWLPTCAMWSWNTKIIRNFPVGRCEQCCLSWLPSDGDKFKVQIYIMSLSLCRDFEHLWWLQWGM